MSELIKELQRLADESQQSASECADRSDDMSYARFAGQAEAFKHAADLVRASEHRETQQIMSERLFGLK